MFSRRGAFALAGLGVSERIPPVRTTLRAGVPIRYAYVVPGGNGTMITVISDEALGYIGSDKSSAKPKEGFDLTYVQLQVNASGKGGGEMAPACKVKWMESGAPAVDDYGKQVVW